jgi:hypothetical protein
LKTACGRVIIGAAVSPQLRERDEVRPVLREYPRLVAALASVAR